MADGDCTGSIAYTQKINGQAAPNLNIIAHTLDDGKEIHGMSVDPGANMTCTLRLMNRSGLVTAASSEPSQSSGNTR